jgi:hypothetical protein
MFKYVILFIQGGIPKNLASEPHLRSIFARLAKLHISTFDGAVTLNRIFVDSSTGPAASTQLPSASVAVAVSTEEVVEDTTAAASADTIAPRSQSRTSRSESRNSDRGAATLKPTPPAGLPEEVQRNVCRFNLALKGFMIFSLTCRLHLIAEGDTLKSFKR